MSAHTLAIIWRCLAFSAIVIAAAVIAFADTAGSLPVQEYDAYLHFAAFVLVTLLALTAFPRAPLTTMLFALVLLGGITELLQFTPGLKRQPDLTDFGFNVLGIDVVLAIVTVARWKARRRQASPAAVAPSELTV